jgi:hypothetical protein
MGEQLSYQVSDSLEFLTSLKDCLS